jgi:hypothetical protein
MLSLTHTAKKLSPDTLKPVIVATIVLDWEGTKQAYII